MLTKYNRRTVTAATGIVYPGAIVKFFNQLTGAPAAVYSDPDGLSSLGTSISSGSAGEIEVFMYPGVYRIRVEDVDGNLLEEIEYEPIVSEFALTEPSDTAVNLLSISVPASDSFLRFNSAGTLTYRTVAQLKSDLSLNNVDNTSDLNKPISTATQTALDAKLDDSQAGTANGLAQLDSGGKVPLAQLPAAAITETFVVGSQAAMLALTAQTGDVAVRTDLNKSYILQGSDPTVLAGWQELLTPTDSVLSVFSRTGAVVAQSGDYTTTLVTEGTNLYHTETRVRDVPLTGLNVALTGDITASDSILQAFGRLQNQLNATFVNSIVAGTGVSVNNTDPANPIVSASGGTVNSIVAGAGVSVDSSTPSAPVVSLSGVMNLSSTSSTAFSLVSGDAGKHFVTTGASPVITIPTGLASGYTVSGFHHGTGNVSFSIAGITLRYNSTLAPNVPQYGVWQIVHVGSNEVELFGFLNAV